MWICVYGYWCNKHNWNVGGGGDVGGSRQQLNRVSNLPLFRWSMIWIRNISVNIDASHFTEKRWIYRISVQFHEFKNPIESYVKYLSVWDIVAHSLMSFYVRESSDKFFFLSFYRHYHNHNLHCYQLCCRE